MVNVIYFGVTRFSVFLPMARDWYISRENNSEAEYLLNLFSEDRMSVRVKIFFQMSLPILELISKDKKFKHIVQYSANLPIKYQNELKIAAEKYEFLILDCIDSETRYDDIFKSIIPNEIKKEIGTSNKNVFGLFYLDDDDLLSSDYLIRMSEYVTEAHIGWYVSFGKGITGFFNQLTNKFENIRSSYYPKLNIGLMRVCSYSFENSNYQMPDTSDHNFVDQAAPLIVDSRNISYFWIRSLFQDTNSTTKRNGLNKDAIFLSLDSYNKLDISENEIKKFPTISNFISRELPNEFLLFENLHINSEVLQIDLPFEISGEISFEYNFLSPIDIKNGALLSLGLANNINEINYIEGMTLSSNPDIGFYRYLKTNINKGTITFSLPNNIKIKKINIFPWGGHSKALIISKLIINFIK